MRIQLELNDKGTQILAEIRSAIGEEGEDRRMSHRELFDYAITFLHWGIRERQKNRIIASLDESEKNYKEVIMPIFTWVVPVAEAVSNSERQPLAVAAAAVSEEVKTFAAAAGKANG